MTPADVRESTRCPRRRSRRLAAVILAAGVGLAAGLGGALVAPPGHGPRLAGPVGLAAQEVPERRGVVAAGLRLRQLDGVKRVLMIGAHPDDEDTSLIAALARGHGAEVAYLSLSRGEGGQNLIGPELDEGLGIVRTGELLAARSLDGGRQFFTRAFDFGYSKSAEETFRYWPRQEVVGDVVWMIRRFRPQVVVSVFDGESPGGHGQHQVAGIATYEAFDAAGDPSRFAEQLTGSDAVEPWAPLKLYRSSRFDRDETTLALETGRFDPLLGRSHFQLSMESRSQHRSQDMGVPEPMGARAAPLALVRNRTGASGGLFAGVDTALLSLADGLPREHADRLRGVLDEYRGAVRAAEAGLDALEPWESVEALGRAARGMERAVAAAAEAEAPAGVRRALEDRLRRVREALLSAAGVVVDVRADDDLVVPGEVLEMEAAVWNGGPFPVVEARAEPTLPEGWSAEPLGPESVETDDSFRARLFGPDPASIVTGASGVEPGEVVRWRYRVRVPEDAEPSRLYYLARPRDGQMYRWPDDRSLWGLPRNPPLFGGSVELSLGAGIRVSAADSSGVSGDGGSGHGAGSAAGRSRSASGEQDAGGEVRVSVRRAGEYVGVDPARGEFRRPVLVAPAVSVRLRPRVMAWPLGAGEARAVAVSLESQARAGARGRLRLEAPPGWTVEP
ncbi:MAG: hypothetical protein GWM92_12225, partial [Gemmatimonadetes bacterium]|nr:PIG-L family deacetylase [Gemmatimonadota bacterium]NIR79465.1 PIG-L family deacetylase [Gemmatimonadota bacterium]NIT88136.1 PIG-L family deacetylase [Gemmatimonadota bacterium]NIU31957.1 PIG-L family deacetylase [Gemmatimonadota bacterium]NIU36569.1 hypothetical protein [Gemmatimonadota bacterium]